MSREHICWGSHLVDTLPPHKHTYTHTHTQHTTHTYWWCISSRHTRASLSMMELMHSCGFVFLFLLTPAAVAASLRPLACPTVWFNGREGEPWAHPAPTSAIQRCGRGTPLSRYHRAIFQLSPVECVCVCVCARVWRSGFMWRVCSARWRRLPGTRLKEREGGDVIPCGLTCSVSFSNKIK